MRAENYQFSYEVYDSIEELNEADAALLREAREATGLAYAPYSKFLVGAMARLINGKTVAGSNQENASYPVGICAERVLLGVISSIYPGVAVESVAITYRGDAVESNYPIAPCGMCRQALQEFENRLGQPVRLILGGEAGNIYVIRNAANLLPFTFTREDLG